MPNDSIRTGEAYRSEGFMQPPRLANLLGFELPIIQGAIGYATCPPLAAAIVGRLARDARVTIERMRREVLAQDAERT